MILKSYLLQIIQTRRKILFFVGFEGKDGRGLHGFDEIKDRFEINAALAKADVNIPGSLIVMQMELANIGAQGAQPNVQRAFGT
jgi:hypothetical protein